MSVREPFKYPKYEDKVRRRKFFPKRGDQNKITEFIEAGFFLSRRKLMTCFSCGIKLKNGIKTVQPLKEHVVLSPYCIYLNKPVMKQKIYKLRDELAKNALDELFNEKPTYQPTPHSPNGTEIENRNNNSPFELPACNHQSKLHTIQPPFDWTTIKLCQIIHLRIQQLMDPNQHGDSASSATPIFTPKPRGKPLPKPI